MSASVVVAVKMHQFSTSAFFLVESESIRVTQKRGGGSKLNIPINF